MGHAATAAILRSYAAANPPSTTDDNLPKPRLADPQVQKWLADTMANSTKLLAALADDTGHDDGSGSWAESWVDEELIDSPKKGIFVGIFSGDGGDLHRPMALRGIDNGVLIGAGLFAVVIACCVCAAVLFVRQRRRQTSGYACVATSDELQPLDLESPSAERRQWMREMELDFGDTSPKGGDALRDKWRQEEAKSDNRAASLASYR